MATELGQQKLVERAVQSAGFTFAVRVAMLLGTTLAAFAVWIFLQAWGDIKQIRDETRGTGVIVGNVQAIQQEQGKRIERIESMFFGRQP